MHKRKPYLGLVGLLALATVTVGSVGTAKAETISDYATYCSQSLPFLPSEFPTDLNCNDGSKFAGGFSGSARLDYVGHRRVNANIDLVFACRWLNNGPVAVPPGAEKTPPFKNAASLEMLIHNRSTGSTCFFAANSGPTHTSPISTAIVSPFASTAESYWMRPDEIENATQFASNPTNTSPPAALRCVGCHIAGPYVASLDIAPHLARFGLLNDGHDTVANMAVALPNTPQYNVVGSDSVGHSTPSTKGFKTWNTRISMTNNLGGCSVNCHSLGNKTDLLPAALDIFVPGARTNELLIPSLTANITELLTTHAMAPYSLVEGRIVPLNSSPYRWMNVDIPDDANTTGDVEDFYGLKANTLGFTPTLNGVLTCETEPAYMEARLVDSKSETTYKSNEYTAANVPLPNKFERFDQTGLICRNAAQTSGMCSNYSVRFICNPDQLSVYSRWTGRVVTIANPDANQVRWARGQPSTPAWYGSQTWHVEGVNDGVHYNYVRFKNNWSGNYLNADASEYVAVAGLRNEWLSEQWVMEYVAGTRYVRFRTLWQRDGRPPLYLTMQENSDYSAVNLQPLNKDAAGNPNWTSQEWELK